MEFLQSILSKLSSAEAASVAAGLAVILQVVLSLKPSDKPQSALLAVSGVLKLIAKVVEAADSLVAKVIPQRLK